MECTKMDACGKHLAKTEKNGIRRFIIILFHLEISVPCLESRKVRVISWIIWPEESIFPMRNQILRIRKKLKKSFTTSMEGRETEDQVLPAVST